MKPSLSSYLLLFAIVAGTSKAFVVNRQTSVAPALKDSIIPCIRSQKCPFVALHAKINKERRDQLGIGDDQDEYDLDVALNENTDPFITKVIAGSLIIAILAGLVVGVIIPATTDYGDMCNPLLTGGRC